MGRHGGLAAFALLAVCLAGCELNVAASTSDAVARSALWPGPVPIDDVKLSKDLRQAFVHFTGAGEFSAGNPCSAKHDGTASIDGDELVIGIYALAHPMPLPSGVGCDLIGYPRSITLDLPAPFTGNLVHDLHQQVLLLAPPDGLAVIQGLPVGWELRDEETLGDSMTPRWMRTYAPPGDAR